MYVCICNGVTEQQVRDAADAGCASVPDLTMRTCAGDPSGSCIGLAAQDAPAGMLARLAKANAQVAPLSACVQDVGGISVRATKQPAILLALRDYVRTPEGGSVVLRRTEKPLQPRDRTYDLRLDDGQWSFIAEAQPTPR